MLSIFWGGGGDGSVRSSVENFTWHLRIQHLQAIVDSIRYTR
jgi:hypothetical protein